MDMQGLGRGDKRGKGENPSAWANRMRVSQKREFLRTRDVAYILDMSPNDVLDLIHKRRLEATKKGKYWRFRLHDVMGYQRAQKEP